MKKTRMKHKVLALTLAVSMMVGMMTGCGSTGAKGSTVGKDSATIKAMVIGDYEIYMDELMVYVLMNTFMDGVTADTAEARSETVKSEALSAIRQNKILYDVALNNKVELDAADLATKDQTVKNFKKSFPKDVFEHYGISDETIDKVFTEQTYVSKFENDIKNDMGKKINDDIAAGYQDVDFNMLYYVVFPKVETDAEKNTPKTDENGKYIELSKEDQEAAKANAEEAAEKINGGADSKEIAKEYGVEAYSTESVGYEDKYTDELKTLLKDLKEGQCTEVQETETGYMTIVMLKVNDEDMKASYAYTLAADTLDKEFKNLEQQWLATIPVDVEKDMEGTVWADYSIVDLVNYLVKAGVLKNK